MNKPISNDVIQEIAGELGVNPAFIEKDWYVVRLIEALSNKEFKGYKPVFAGGTSLSKGYSLIERFSEDLDFKIVNARSLNRDQRRNIRQEFVDCIKQIEDFQVTDENIKVRNEGKACCLYIKYPNNVDFPSFLRPFLQVELFFDDENLSYETREISSFVSRYTKIKSDWKRWLHKLTRDKQKFY
ncbi:MAG: nucleotidyl transferase AbiEii/AbiGii toxin family protein [Alphaproteobacteria bacterium]|nr:nucleotidyl transferase AbiEii/AbiGii toxin family protein [Alphaproteobacteria bacterium]